MSYVPKGNVIQTMTHGKTKIYICDDHVKRTPEEIARVWKEYDAVGSRLWRTIVAERTRAAEVGGR
ncbi:hypothetical protein PA598K_01375 [Paenibacillus sp. 598K]|uniref:hypothetical protein n=1 Tax=Paenibacillus sp. 598K TaxID=1117987 RepID=UPI000FFAE55F|nr:hypothetical protein [Paenibacillus sp. 598K]GBF73090.1 hypothetical protein PA598K_01375 [Paenibacillus sp. 598K]